MNGSSCFGRPAIRGGFTLVELLICILILAGIVILLLPATRRATEAGNRTYCGNNLKQLGLGLHSYHDAHGHFPPAMGVVPAGDSSPSGTNDRLSGLVHLLPYLEQEYLWKQISSPSTWNGVTYPAMGPAPTVTTYPPWQQELKVLRCPTDTLTKSSEMGRTNYAFCIGDMTENIHNPTQLRGAFGCRLVSRLKDITDGTSHTIAMTEIGTAAETRVAGQFVVKQSRDLLTAPGRCLSWSSKNHYKANAPLSSIGRGGRWADGAAGVSLVQTILPPNSPSCAVEGMEAVDGIYSAGSYHPGIVQVLMLDGSFRVITSRIDAGDPHQAPVKPLQFSEQSIPSPFGVWGAIGTANGNEKMISFDF